VTLFFVLPFLVFDNSFAVAFSVLLGLFLVFLLSVFVAKRSEKSIFESVFEHVGLAIIVIVASYFVGGLAERIV
jgi:VIT1/CCC1 family predicted Fe2+/Mn2+ transporter